MTSDFRPSTATRSGAIAAANPAAVEAARQIHEQGGNAVDAAIAAQAAIFVTMPQSAGFGGDMLALVKAPDGKILAINGTGKSPSTWPTLHADTVGNSVTVPGAIQGWFDLHERFGQLPISDVLVPAAQLARDGIPVDAAFIASIDAQRARIDVVSPHCPILGLRLGDIWTQPALADLIDDLRVHGPAAFYQGPRAEAITRTVRKLGGSLAVADFEAHASHIGTPVSTPWDGGIAYVQPPSSQGVLLAMALHWLDPRFHTYPPAHLDHILIELTNACFGHRSDCDLGDQLLNAPLEIDSERAAHKSGPRAYLHTAGVATADADGFVVSSLVSVFDDFGSAAWVPEIGIFLNNRAAGFTDGANRAAPGKRPIHTLAPMMYRSPDGQHLAVATPGADGQVQTLLQVVCKLRAGYDLHTAIHAPRWRSQDQQLLIQDDHENLAELQRRGHKTSLRPGGDDVFGAVVAAGNNKSGPYAASDWRRQTTFTRY